MREADDMSEREERKLSNLIRECSSEYCVAFTMSAAVAATIYPELDFDDLFSSWVGGGPL